MKNILLTILACLCASFIAYICLRENEFTAEELAAASGIVRWHIQFPDDLKDDEFLALAWFDGENCLRYDTNLQGDWRGGRVAAYLWTHKGPNWMKFTVRSGGAENKDTLIGQLKPIEQTHLLSHRHSGSTVREGDAIMTFSKDGGDSEIRLRIVRNSIANISVQTRCVPAKESTPAEPGATDNPGDAQRI
jgi:hypothetical protein